MSLKIQTDLYNLLHTGNSGDIAYYVNRCRGAASVLELGCGCGRVSLPLAEAGLEVVGVDNSEGMAASFGATMKAHSPATMPTFVLGDMRDVQLGRHFDRVIIPFNALLCMLTPTDVITALKNAAAHLAPDGELIFDIYYVPRSTLEDAAGDDAVYELGEITYHGQLVRVSEQAILHGDPQRFDTRHFFVGDGADGLYQEITIPQRCILLADIGPLLTEAGLQMVELVGDFGGEPIDDSTEQLVIRAIRAPLL